MQLVFFVDESLLCTVSYFLDFKIQSSAQGLFPQTKSSTRSRKREAVCGQGFVYMEMQREWF